MLSLLLRIFLLATAFCFIFIVIRNINRGKLLLQYSLSWLVLSVAMIIVGIFPQIASWLAHLIHIQEPSNFVYAIGLFILLFFAFAMTGKISKQSSDLRELTEQEAIDRYFIQQLLEDQESAQNQSQGEERL